MKRTAEETLALMQTAILNANKKLESDSHLCYSNDDLLEELCSYVDDYWKDEVSHIKETLSNMKVGEEITIYGIDGTDDNVVPNLALGVTCQQYFDSENKTYLCGVYGSDSDFTMFRKLEYDCTYDMVEDMFDWLFITARNLIGSTFRGLSLVNNKE